ncbi:MAG TPA: TonB family protein [Pyrinomonadaceae bacterium]|nr:TonB family protein [Pyrinomonadaceae bacterium]
MNGLKLVTVVFTLTFATTVFAQSGRRTKTAPAPSPTPEAQPSPSPTPSLPPRVPVTAEKDQDYRCTADGTLAHLLDNGEVAGFTAKEVDTKAEITAKPDPTYTRDARRVGVEGVVVLKVLLLPDEKIDRVRVVRRLPYGLTENAIFAACAIKFRPAVKAGKAVPQWVSVQYVFRLASSSIFGP